MSASVKPANLVFIMSDEHSRFAMGCYGHPIVRTPNLDALAASGTLFTNAYTNCPICVPSRASFSTGRYIHEIGYWDNAHPYDGKVPGWGHRLQETGHRCTSVGKLHFRNPHDPTGFHEQIHPMHVVDGMGDLLGSIRDELPVRYSAEKFATQIGPGESTYTKYDAEIVDLACRWLAEEAARYADSPWMLYVSFVAPHFPLIAPPRFYDMYPAEEMPLPRLHPLRDEERHPWINALRNCQVQDRYFTDETRRIAIASYFGLCSYLDDNIGRVLRTIEEAGLSGNTRIVYVSDHGESLGVRGVWGKSNMYEEAVGVPLMMAGPGVPAGRTVETPVSLADAYPTILECVGEPLTPEETALPGDSLFRRLEGSEDPGRGVFSEYHAAGAKTAAYMIRRGRYKYVHYVDFAPELFDLDADPGEERDISGDPANAEFIRNFEAELRGMLDPEEVDRRAKRDQAALIERHGGREAILNLGSTGATPPPGAEAEYS